MTAKIYEFKAKETESETHFTGEAKCLTCEHKWVAVAPAGTTWLVCPECQTLKGRFIYPHHVSPGAYFWMCECGNELFIAHEDGFMCPNCGLEQMLPE